MASHCGHLGLGPTGHPQRNCAEQTSEPTYKWWENWSMISPTSVLHWLSVVLRPPVEWALLVPGRKRVRNAWGGKLSLCAEMSASAPGNRGRGPQVWGRVPVVCQRGFIRSYLKLGGWELKRRKKRKNLVNKRVNTSLNCCLIAERMPPRYTWSLMKIIKILEVARSVWLESSNLFTIDRY